MLKINYWRIAKALWATLPILVLAAVVLFLWLRPSQSSYEVRRSHVSIAGKAALTEEAEDWKEQPGSCSDASGTFSVVTRELTVAEEQAIALKYGAVFAFAPQARTLNLTLPEGDTRTVARVFGEYHAPRMRYGGTGFASVLSDGEFQMVYAADAAPRFGWLGVYGLGGFYDLTANDTQDGFAAALHHRAYVFFEPFQTKQVYWRIEGGMLHTSEEWTPYAGVTGEWRSEPMEWKWLRKMRTGLTSPL